MYSVTVPYLLAADDHRQLCSQQVVDALKALDASRLALFIDDWQNTQKNKTVLSAAAAFFKGHGLKTALWVSGFLHQHFEGNFTRMVYADGHVGSTPCPLDDNFKLYYGGLLKQYASENIEMIFIDDDFRIHISHGTACFCPLHLQKYREILGNVSKSEIISGIMSRSPNKFRSAWLRVNGQALKGFAAHLRNEVDTVNPNMRLGLCASPTHLDIDGVGADELSIALAGGTKPFLRLIGAPYWAAKNICRLNDVIGCERMLINEFKDFPGEIIAEGDAYPRPRYATPAAYLENFELALCTQPRLNGILKYAVDYYSAASYEQGYYSAALTNRDFRNSLREAFTGNFTGYCIRERFNQIENMVYPEGFSQGQLEWRAVLPASLKLLGDLSIPYCFTGDYPEVVFGENGKYFLPNSAVLDITAAKHLKDRGVDTGYISDVSDRLSSQMLQDNCIESFALYDDSVKIHGMLDIQNVSVVSEAEVTSWFLANGKRYIASYRYKNKSGQRFAVLCYDAEHMKNVIGLGRNYYKQRLLIDNYQWLSGSPLDAVCIGNPDLYIMTALERDRLSIAFFNNFPDYIASPIFTLGGTAKTVQYKNCKGSLNGNTIQLEKIQPYAGGMLIING